MAAEGVFAVFNRSYERFAAGYEGLLERALDQKFIVMAAVAILFVGSLAMFPLLGTELFPETDAGTFTINFRAPAGTRIELTTDMAREIESIVRKVIPPQTSTWSFQISALLPASPRFTHQMRLRIGVHAGRGQARLISVLRHTTLPG